MKVMKILGLAAVGAVLALAAPTQQAQALSLATPAAAATVQDDSSQMTTQVHWHGHHGWHRGWHHGWHRHHHRHWR